MSILFVYFYLSFWHVCYKLRFRVTADGEEDVYTQPVWHAEWTRQVFMQRGVPNCLYKQSATNVVKYVERVKFRSHVIYYIF